VIGKRRVRSGLRAWEEFRPDVCLLDDGFQYRRLEKALEIVLVNAANPFGYGHLLPRGMLRESLRSLRRADAVILTHAGWTGEEERERLRAALRRWNPELALAEARHLPVRLRAAVSGEALPLEALRGGRWLALSSLGQPESFERTLADLGAAAVGAARFPDHHPYTEENVRSVCNRVRSEEWSGLVTTEKDSVKIATEWLAGARAYVLEIDLQFLRGQDAVESLVRSRTGL
jgi:tetraacyldisaccharide 4'-kinase